MVKEIISALGTFASILSLAFIPDLTGWLKTLIIAVGIISLAELLYLAIVSNQINKRNCHTKEEIRNTMKDIITSDGEVRIMSRNLSWVTDDISRVLIEKKDDVTIYAQSPNETLRKLAERGVRIKYYGKFDFVPKTRFTVLRFSGKDPQVAIAETQNSVKKTKKTVHTIYQTVDNEDIKDHWINCLATDLITLCDEVSKEER